MSGIPNEDPNHFVLLSSRPLSSVIEYGDYVRYLHFPLDFLRWSLTSGFPSADIAGRKRRFRNCFFGRNEVPRDSQNDRCIHQEVLRHMSLLFDLE